MEQAQASAQKVLGPIVATVSNPATNISNTVSSEQNIITPFKSLMRKLDVLVKIGDEIIKVCSSVSYPLLHERN